MKRLGIDIGSTTVKVAVIDEDNNILFSEYKRHFARIKETLRELLENAVSTIGDDIVAPLLRPMRLKLRLLSNSAVRTPRSSIFPRTVLNSV